MERSKMTIANVILNVRRKSRNCPGRGKTITNRIDITLIAIKTLPPYPFRRLEDLSIDLIIVNYATDNPLYRFVSS